MASRSTNESATHLPWGCWLQLEGLEADWLARQDHGCADSEASTELDSSDFAQDQGRMMHRRTFSAPPSCAGESPPDCSQSSQESLQSRRSSSKDSSQVPEEHVGRLLLQALQIREDYFHLQESFAAFQWTAREEIHGLQTELNAAHDKISALQSQLSAMGREASSARMQTQAAMGRLCERLSSRRGATVGKTLRATYFEAWSRHVVCSRLQSSYLQLRMRANANSTKRLCWHAWTYHASKQKLAKELWALQKRQHAWNMLLCRTANRSLGAASFQAWRQHVFDGRARRTLIERSMTVIARDASYSLSRFCFCAWERHTSAWKPARECQAKPQRQSQVGSDVGRRVLLSICWRIWSRLISAIVAKEQRATEFANVYQAKQQMQLQFGSDVGRHVLLSICWRIWSRPMSVIVAKEQTATEIGPASDKTNQTDELPSVAFSSKAEEVLILTAEGNAISSRVSRQDRYQGLGASEAIPNDLRAIERPQSIAMVSRHSWPQQPRAALLANSALPYQQVATCQIDAKLMSTKGRAQGGWTSLPALSAAARSFA